LGPQSGSAEVKAMPSNICHHVAVLTKWFRLKWSTRFAIVVPSFTMIGFTLDLMDHATGMSPLVTLPVGLILMSFLLKKPTESQQNAR
jgi:hypothetical protein